jgi:bifunctional DNA-binding transcriptional regulator/antitoxin component of YhaV-PrlF toxin-antitoxin module
MTYTSHITVKGQITIPGIFRKKLRLKKSTKLSLSLDEKTGIILVKPLPDFFQLAENFKVPAQKDVMKAREFMENNYERI